MDDPTEMATCAVVDFDADEILQRRELVQMVQSKDKELVKVCFWDTIWFYSLDLEEFDQELYDSFEDACHQWIVLPDRINHEAMEQQECLQTDCEMIVLHHNSVSWQAYPKHGPPGILTTSSLSYEQVIKLKEQADGKSEAHR